MKTDPVAQDETVSVWLRHFEPANQDAAGGGGEGRHVGGSAGGDCVRQRQTRSIMPERFIVSLCVLCVLAVRPSVLSRATAICRRLDHVCSHKASVIPPSPAGLLKRKDTRKELLSRLALVPGHNALIPENLQP